MPKKWKIGKNISRGLCCRAAYTAKNFFKTQNPRLINESGFKSRAAYDGACTVGRWVKIWEFVSQFLFRYLSKYQFLTLFAKFLILHLLTIPLPLSCLPSISIGGTITYFKFTCYIITNSILRMLTNLKLDLIKDYSTLNMTWTNTKKQLMKSSEARPLE